jgi:2-polyprenyl-3-methyl-5-hydroxy-6-metoxy-1,4-benzoquinol methylase
MDRATHYKIGDCFRKWLNINTPSYWDRYLAAKSDSWRVFPYEFLLNELPKDRPFSLLDIGCALGEGCELLKKHFPNGDIYGADLSPGGIKKAISRSGSGKYFCLDIGRDVPPRSYDYITLIHILEHFDYPFPIIDKCLKYVKEAIFVSTPYTENFEDPRLYWKGEHRYLFNEHTFKDYHCTVVGITDFIEAVGSRHIRYKIMPR